jgi:hypothetical protein
VGSDDEVVKNGWHEATSATITRLVCSTILALVVLVGAGVMLLIHPEYANAAIAFIGVVVGASFGYVRSEGARRAVRRHD